MGFFGNLFRAAPAAKGIHGNPSGLPSLAGGIQRVMEDRIAILEASPSYPALRAAHLTIKAHAAVQAAYAPGERAWSRALWWGAMCAEALLQCATPSEAEVYFHREVTVPAADEPAPGLVQVWREGFQMAVLAGYDEVAKALQRFTIERLRARDATTSEAELLYAHALQGVFARSPDLGARMQAAVEQIVQPTADDVILRLLGAEAECLFAVVIGDAAKLHSALTRGLDEHQTYWTHDERATKPEGLFALGLSFVARLATDAGMRVDVRSPYLVYSGT